MSVFFLIILLHAVSYASAFTPAPLLSQATTLNNGLLYFYGGTSMNPNSLGGATTQFFALNVTSIWNTSAPSYVDLSSTVPAGAIPVFGATAVIASGKIVIALGFTSVNASQFLTYTPNQSPVWAALQSSNPQDGLLSGPQITDTTMAVSPIDGRIYISGGMTSTGPNTALYALDVSSLSWTNIMSAYPGNITNIPSTRLGAVAVATKDGRICYIGGFIQTNGAGAQTTEIWCFATPSGVWSRTATTGVPYPEPRANHTAVLDQNGNIVVFGGAACTQTSPTYCTLVPTISLAILNTTSFAWTIPSTENGPPSLYGHSAAVVGNQMIVAFGAMVHTPTLPNNYTYVLDMSNGYSWTSQFNPNPNSPSSSSTFTNTGGSPTTSPSSTPSTTTSIIPIVVGVAGGAVVLMACIAIVAVYVLKKGKKLVRLHSSAEAGELTSAELAELTELKVRADGKKELSSGDKDIMALRTGDSSESEREVLPKYLNRHLPEEKPDQLIVRQSSRTYKPDSIGLTNKPDEFDNSQGPTIRPASIRRSPLANASIARENMSSDF
ncbi:hypothetical protein BC937DRAFT_92687 [Endogone sp. FLAS-F59071]|nr:hypothetical protein BC937DRAFT_92687 [Endogone sp. FLAS-F59071]|eukprot:RUS21435.1 hypothetical protein BC937DRAFT_92687 [Endogone sp. FLAS-F59071]